jgi:hypothetical protein
MCDAMWVELFLDFSLPKIGGIPNGKTNGFGWVFEGEIEIRD